ncbi:Reverse transcriptase domain-containing protein [Caenorhabditis elegans]|uniref:Reverse transcriptase domain-containing protein n=1 Tax=Caenorhabditis elegans TaxID=6239 RepID=A0A486WWE5_CAEEL|nr:Reverse transcriptase domain-containing protein [Caenorhabditis elegans]VGM69510.1 Reverse transcriptase domain-containing protein [Caenorhabditis elegans]
MTQFSVANNRLPLLTNRQLKPYSRRSSWKSRFQWILRCFVRFKSNIRTPINSYSGEVGIPYRWSPTMPNRVQNVPQFTIKFVTQEAFE